eukprot:NODE_574_length_6555_cov_0.194703.p4 type:complete len:102 gc:universal NODE_574_length_6555_cov_0.194703:5271-4966(-)
MDSSIKADRLTHLNSMHFFKNISSLNLSSTPFAWYSLSNSFVQINLSSPSLKNNSGSETVLFLLCMSNIRGRIKDLKSLIIFILSFTVHSFLLNSFKKDLT